MVERSRQQDGASRGLLGDTPSRAYGGKLELFNRFAEPEIRQLIQGLTIQPGDYLLDAGCGVGLASRWLADQTGPLGLVAGCDLSRPHLRLARELPSDAPVAFVQSDIATPPFRSGSFDLVWCANTINHLTDPVDAVRRLATTVRPGGRIALVQSGFLPDMFFAWDERLERAVTAAVRAYYRDKYDLTEQATTAMRGLVGLAQRGGLTQLETRTAVIERTQQLSELDRAYFQDAVFSGYWGERLRSYLTPDDWLEVQRLCDPASAAYCLDRPDFHHIQTLTMVVGRLTTQ